MDNVVLADDGTVRAILDWEICTLGDPLADLGLLMVYWADPTDTTAVLGLSPTTAPGFSTRAQVLERYDSVSDLDVSEVGYYMAFGYWKLACILQGVYARYVAGAGAGDQGSVDGFPAQIGHGSSRWPPSRWSRCREPRRRRFDRDLRGAPRARPP